MTDHEEILVLVVDFLRKSAFLDIAQALEEEIGKRIIPLNRLPVSRLNELIKKGLAFEMLVSSPPLVENDGNNNDKSPRPTDIPTSSTTFTTSALPTETTSGTMNSKAVTITATTTVPEIVSTTVTTTTTFSANESSTTLSQNASTLAVAIPNSDTKNKFESTAFRFSYERVWEGRALSRHSREPHSVTHEEINWK
eukprot:TRINITY_DN25384_c0_g1_i1.p1 TRINITY_DN25384_c0_g1~~TRINITY_DN25384_c0_g1_i1.p1  ORF type:complete len:196 (-),score=36.41 TRINITY_DN25384_c0_g1_i1:178-765(-)